MQRQKQSAHVRVGFLLSENVSRSLGTDFLSSIMSKELPENIKNVKLDWGVVMYDNIASLGYMNFDSKWQVQNSPGTIVEALDMVMTLSWGRDPWGTISGSKDINLLIMIDNTEHIVRDKVRYEATVKTLIDSRIYVYQFKFDNTNNDDISRLQDMGLPIHIKQFSSSKDLKDGVLMRQLFQNQLNMAIRASMLESGVK